MKSISITPATLVELTCHLVREWLPSYVDAEMCDIAHQPRFADLRNHLATCTACAAEHADLLESVLWRENLYLLEQQLSSRQSQSGRPI